MGIPSNKAEGLETFEKFIKVDGLTEVKEGNVTYYFPQRLRATGALIALGCQINGYGIQMDEKLSKQIKALVDAAERMTDEQAQTILKAAKLGWELSGIDVVGREGAVFNLKSPGGSKAKVDIAGKFVR